MLKKVRLISESEKEALLLKEADEKIELELLGSLFINTDTGSKDIFLGFSEACYMVVMTSEPIYSGYEEMPICPSKYKTRKVKMCKMYSTKSKAIHNVSYEDLQNYWILA